MSLKVYEDKWEKLSLGSNSREFEWTKEDVENLTNAALTIYKEAGEEYPSQGVKFFDGPSDAIKYIQKRYKIEDKRDISFAAVWNEINFFGHYEAHWLAWYDYVISEKTDDLANVDHRIFPMVELAKKVGICWMYDNVFVITKPAVRTFQDDTNRPHSVVGPSYEFSDGYKIYTYHGVEIPGNWVENPESITAKDVDKQSNAELRRIMIELMDIEKYIKDSKFTVKSKDNFGILWERDLGDRRLPVTVVQVKNSTPEPDGSYKDYFLRVPPDMQRPKQAIAWTFSKQEDEYNPIIET